MLFAGKYETPTFEKNVFAFNQQKYLTDSFVKFIVKTIL